MVILQSYADFMNIEKIRVLIHGHTDNIGEEAYNLVLSHRRATAVVEQLVKFGVSRNQFEVYSYGETAPIADNETEAGRLANRRVEFVFFR